MNTNQSEVARVRAQIKAEYEAGQRAVYATREGSARHAVINANMERLSQQIEKVKQELGTQEAMRLACELLEGEALQRPQQVTR